MGSCVVLGDATVQDLLINFSREEILTFLDRVANSLRDFAVGSERSYQPDPAVVERDDGRKNLFRLFTTSTGVGVKIIVDPAGAFKSEKPPATEAERAERNKLVSLHGVLVVCDENGLPSGFINAEEVTGYRTSLSALILYVRRRRTANVVVFGAGKQALWHIRLALALRGEDIKRITVINRTDGRSTDLLSQLSKENDARWQAPVQWDYKSANDAEGLKQVLAEADAVFCTTPSKQQLFPAEYLITKKGGCYVSAIGSWTAEMIELDPKILQHAARENGEDSMVVVDDKHECCKATGELVQSGLRGDEITEVGELVDLMTKPADQGSTRVRRCLEEGFVVYKSVGVGLTDLASGQALLELARQKNQGVMVPDF